MVDEVGKMEMFCESFVREVRSLLENPTTTVLTTIPVAKGKPIPLVEEIRHRKDAVLYQVIIVILIHRLFRVLRVILAFNREHISIGYQESNCHIVSFR